LEIETVAATRVATHIPPTIALYTQDTDFIHTPVCLYMFTFTSLSQGEGAVPAASSFPVPFERQRAAVGSRLRNISTSGSATSSALDVELTDDTDGRGTNSNSTSGPAIPRSVARNLEAKRSRKILPPPLTGDVISPTDYEDHLDIGSPALSARDLLPQVFGLIAWIDTPLESPMAHLLTREFVEYVIEEINEQILRQDHQKSSRIETSKPANAESNGFEMEEEDGDKESDGGERPKVGERGSLRSDRGYVRSYRSGLHLCCAQLLRVNYELRRHTGRRGPQFSLLSVLNHKPRVEAERWNDKANQKSDSNQGGDKRECEEEDQEKWVQEYSVHRVHWPTGV